MQTEVSVLPGIIMRSIDTSKAFLELHFHQAQFLLRKIILLLMAFGLMHVYPAFLQTFVQCPVPIPPKLIHKC